ncbi:hypothetical protein M432DRAFT_627518 [Thermoascus aurantiacus ATCC 26904]
MPRKRSRDTTADRLSLATAIQHFGFQIVPCVDCVSQGLECRVGPHSNCCSECILRGSTMCDASQVSVATMNRIRRQQERIQAEEALAYAEFQQASEELERLQNQMRSTSAKLLRLRKQQRLLEERGYAVLGRESENAESLEEDRKLLESLVSEGNEASKEGRQSKRPCHRGPGVDPSSSNT